jgi:plastocyanin
VKAKAVAHDATPAPAPSPTAAASQTYKVLVDGHTADNSAAFIAFFPKKVQVHPGDTVVFHSMYSGEPHTVALGTAVNVGLAKVEAILKKNPHALDNAPPPAEFLKIPQLLPQGPGDAIQAGAQPCVVAAGAAIPTKNACATQKLAEFDGTQQLDTSGWLGTDSDFSITFAKTTPPGSYRFMCQLHGPEMTGQVDVVAPTAPVKEPAAVEAEGVAARDAVLAKLKPGFAALAKATPAHAFAGGGVPSVQSALITAFGPKDIKIPVGGTVSWTVLGPHSIAFNAPADAQSFRLPGAGTSVHLAQKAVFPAGGPGADPSVQQLPPVVNGKTWNGVGFRSSGLIFGNPPPHTTAFQLRFSKAGTYQFQCTVHEDMKGTVTVG